MRPPTELDDVSWHELTRAFRPADDVPELVSPPSLRASPRR
ncbi:hypothetical protein [Streptomyces triticirhizae]|nr:hypothetical protein [Streptomyces triticirhizae]